MTRSIQGHIDRPAFADEPHRVVRLVKPLRSVGDGWQQQASQIASALRPFAEMQRQVAVLRSVVDGGQRHAAQPDDNASERDSTAVYADVNSALIAFPLPAHGEVVLAAGFNLSFTPMAAPQAIESGHSGAEFHPSHWQVLVELEQRLRCIVEETLSEKIGPSWIKKRIPQSMRQRWEERQEKDRTAGRSVYAAIQYSDFMDLADIVGRSDNWKEAFQPIFRNRDDFIASFRRLHPLRKAIAHSRPLDRADVLTLIDETTRIFRALGMYILH